MKKTSEKFVFAAMFAALICVATMIIRIPSPMNGYVNFGDCFVLLAAWILGPAYGFAAGGIGSALADLFAGYVSYIPATFLIKGLMALAAALVAGRIIKKAPGHLLVGYVAGSLLGESIMIVGYFLYAALIFGKGLTAFLSVPGNVVQGAVGMAAAILLINLLRQTGLFHQINVYTESKESECKVL